TPRPEIKGPIMPAPSGPMPHLKGKLIPILIAVGLLGLLYWNRNPKGPQGPTSSSYPPAPPVQRLRPLDPTTPPARSPNAPPAADAVPVTPQLTPEEQRRQELIDQRMQLEAKAAFETNIIAKETKRDQNETIPQPIATPSTPVETAAKEPASKALDFNPNQPLYTLPEG